MTPDPEYTVKKVEVWRVVGPDGCEVMDEDDEGREYPLDFDTYEAAFQGAAERMQCRVPYGPKTKTEQEISDSLASMADMLKGRYGYRFSLEASKPMPFAGSQTIQFIRSN